MYSVNHMASLLFLFVVLVVSHLGFWGGNLVLIASVLIGHCLKLLLITYGALLLLVLYKLIID